MRRRSVLRGLTLAPFAGLPSPRPSPPRTGARETDSKGKFDLRAFEKARVARAGERYLDQPPITITASSSPRSTGGPHDFFSEGDYWWPDPKNPNGPYIQRDGMSNPENFVEHRRALMRLSVQVPALTAAWMVTGDKKYAEHAAVHLQAWFIDPKTMMYPHLRYAQAIHNLVTGRSTGVIDTLHLVEVARSASALERSGALTAAEQTGVKKWFSEYLTWITTHDNGTKERDARNNHGTCWVAQAAEFAHLTGNSKVTDFCRDRFKTVLLPDQVAADGSFPEELRRTKPYGYSLFQLDVLSTVCQILSAPKDNLWTYRLPDGRGMAKVLAYMFPFIADKKRWQLKPDVMYFSEWPIRHPSLIFAGLALDRPEYVELWKKLEPEPKVEEVVRNYPIRQPVLWVAPASGNHTG
jgi:alginate lyase